MPTCVQRWIDGFVSEARGIDIGPMDLSQGPKLRVGFELCGGLFWPKGNNRPVAAVRARAVPTAASEIQRPFSRSRCLAGARPLADAT
jgi:hypothetical protein